VSWSVADSRTESTKSWLVVRQEHGRPKRLLGPVVEAPMEIR
jgi:hypothetical protein